MYPRLNLIFCWILFISVLFSGDVEGYNGGKNTRKLYNEHQWEVTLVKNFKEDAFSTIYNYCPEPNTEGCGFSRSKGLKISGDSSDQEYIKIHGLISNEVHLNDNCIQDNVEYGLLFVGQKHKLHFWLDSRIYTLVSDSEKFESPDGEILEIQEKGEGSNFSYGSFARATTDIFFKSPIGLLGFHRKPFHWGPGSFYNLVFSEYAPTFPAFYFKTSVGFFSLQSLWGNLSSGAGDNPRYIYAKRYEFKFKWLLLGISEQMIVYKNAMPEAIVPTSILFMEKGQGFEENNNGLISFDLLLNLPFGQSIYGEFLIDDLQEPTSLFNDFWANKWAAMAGLRMIFPDVRSSGADVGGIVEYSRAEPFVYTHYFENTSQLAQRGQPLGFHLGPNAEAFKVHSFLNFKEKWRISLGYERTAEGQNGGDLNEPTDSLYQRYWANIYDSKSFLDHAERETSFVISGSYFFHYMSLSTTYSFNRRKSNVLYTRFHFQF